MTKNRQNRTSFSIDSIYPITMLAFPQTLLLDIAGPLQVFSSANQMLQSPYYVLRIASENGQPVTTDAGVRISADHGFDVLPAAGDIIVPGGPGVDLVLRNDCFLDYIRRASRNQKRIISVCSGSLLLAEVGLLDGREATSHWVRVADIKDRYPKVFWQPESIFTRDGNVYCSAGVTAGIDLALSLVEADLGRDMALDVARELIVYIRRSGGQSQYSKPLMAQRAVSSKIHDLCCAITEDPTKDWRISRMSVYANITERSLHRYFVREHGESPSRFVLGARLDFARTLLDHDGRSIEEIARLSGFSSAQALCRAFAKNLSITPKEYRDRFGRLQPVV